MTSEAEAVGRTRRTWRRKREDEAGKEDREEDREEKEEGETVREEVAQRKADGVAEAQNDERPPDDELDRMYRRLLDELNIPESKRGSMLAQPMHMKWKLLSKHQRYVRVQTNKYGSYGGAVRCVEILDGMLVGSEQVREEDVIDFRMEVKEDGEWIQVFLELGGLDKMLRLIDIVQEHQRHRLLVDLLECCAIMTSANPNTVNALLMSPENVAILVLCLRYDPARPKIATVLLKVLQQLVEDSRQGRQFVVSAFEVYRVEKQESMRYETLCKCLGTEEQSFGLEAKATILGFVNALIDTDDSLEGRMALRTELCFLGLLHFVDDFHGVVDLLRAGDDRDGRSRDSEDLVSLADAVARFRASKERDHAQVLDNAPSTGSWLSDAEVVFAKVLDLARSTGGVQHVLQVLHAMVVVPQNARAAARTWSLMAETCQNIVASPQGVTLTFKEVEESFLQRDSRFRALQAAERRSQELEDVVASNSKEMQLLKERNTNLTNQLADLKAKHEEEIKIAKEQASKAVASVAISAPSTDGRSSAVPEASEQSVAAVDPKFEKYAKMKKAGLPQGAIENCMIKDGVNDADREEFFAARSKLSAPATEMKAPTLDPKFAKYAKMKKAGLPQGAIENCMVKDGVSGQDREVFFGAASGAQAIASSPNAGAKNAKASAQPSMQEDWKKDPKLGKYQKMRQARIPEPAIRHKMIQDGLDQSDQDRFFGTTGSENGAKTEEASPPPPPLPPKVPEKAKIEPRKPMRALFWSKLPAERVDGTLWLDLDDKQVDLDLESLESQFAQAPKTEKTSKSATSTGPSPGASVGGKASGAAPKIELLDPKRLQNVGIAFARLRMSPQMLKMCILELDLKRLGGGTDRVGMLQNMIPTPEECNTLREFAGDKASLGKVESLFLELSTVTHLSQRIKAWTTQVRFKPQVAEHQENAQALLKACKDMKRSTALKQTLRVILAVGNYLNGKSARGGAYGFKLDLLTKIQNLKSSDNKGNLLRYIVQQVAEKDYPGMLKLPKDLESVQAAARISLSALSASAKALENDLKFCTTLVDKIGDPEGTFAKVISAFHSSGAKQLNNLRTTVQEVEQQYTEILESYAADDEDMKRDSERFFGIFSDFVAAFKREISPAQHKQSSRHDAVIDAAKAGAPARLRHLATSAPP